MSNEEDILGRPPARKPVEKQEYRGDEDWRGEHHWRVWRNEGGAVTFSANNARRKAKKIKQRCKK